LKWLGREVVIACLSLVYLSGVKQPIFRAALGKKTSSVRFKVGKTNNH
jgi:hypothetical protein